jgi:hypothetical protein
MYLWCLWWHADQAQSSVASEQIESLIEIVLCRYCIQDKIEIPSGFLHSVSIGRYQEAVRPEALRISFLRRGRTYDCHLSAESHSKFDSHVTQATKPNYADLVSLPDLPMPQGRVRGDSRTQKWRNSPKIQ